MEFNANSGFMYVVVAIVIAFVILQSVVFLAKAWKRGLQLGMEKKALLKTVSTSAIFSIAPAVAILLGVIALSKALGFPLPWLRLTVIGSLTYETTAAAAALCVVIVLTSAAVKVAHLLADRFLLDRLQAWRRR